MAAPRTIKTLAALRNAIRAERAAGRAIALVPTMGALHDGHLSLVRQAKAKADTVIVSIYVNPTQFAANEDLGRYPRDPKGDTAKLGSVGTDMIWMPETDVMYPDGFATKIIAKGAAEGLETDFRPEHFSGVATVCAKLFNQVTPDIAVFGEKDYQQLAVIRQLVRDLNLDLKILGGPTVREKDGLAMSSRNRYLSDNERQTAVAMIEALKSAAQGLKDGKSTKSVEAAATRALLKAGFQTVDYVAVRDAETLAPFKAGAGGKARILAAAWLGTTRLIDNWPAKVPAA